MHAGTHAQTDTRARQSAKLDERYRIVIVCMMDGQTAHEDVLVGGLETFDSEAVQSS